MRTVLLLVGCLFSVLTWSV